jgi:hypothetical protein
VDASLSCRSLTTLSISWSLIHNISSKLYNSATMDCARPGQPGGGVLPLHAECALCRLVSLLADRPHRLQQTNAGDGPHHFAVKLRALLLDDVRQNGFRKTVVLGRVCRVLWVHRPAGVSVPAVVNGLEVVAMLPGLGCGNGR